MYLKKVYLLILFIVLFTLTSYTQPAGYGFGKQITFLSSQVSGGSPLINFPVLLSFTDNDLRSVGNGGSVENINGFDIIFTTNSCFTITTLDHQIESYNPVTGVYIAWVKIPSLSNSTNTNIFMYYGNSSVSTNPSTSAVWTVPGYDGVWHLHNNFTDASGNGNNGVNNGSTNVPSAHNSANGRNFVDPNHWIELPSHNKRTGSFSYSGWMRTNDRTRAGQRMFCDDANNDNGGHSISLGDPGSGRVRFYIRGLGPVSLDSPSGTILNNTWHYVAASYNSTTTLKSLYIDGVLVASGNASGTLGTPTGNASIGGEIASGESGNRFHGDLDEIRSFPGVLSAAWIATEYNNQNSPSTFYSLTAEVTAAELCATLPIELLSFDATTNNKTVELTWTTATEINNNYFTIEKSKNTTNWDFVAEIDGAGNTNHIINYQTTDEKPYLGTSYYRLKQTDFDGKYSYSDIKAVTFNGVNDVNIYPNPTKNNITIEAKETELNNLILYNYLGSSVKLKIINSNQQKVILDLSNLASGIYTLKTGSNYHKIYKQ